MKTDVLTFDEWTDYLALTIDQKIIKHNEDNVLLVCGYEGSGKSVFTLASACETNRKRGHEFDKDLIFYNWEEYLKTNLNAMLGQLDSYPPQLVADLIQYYKITKEQTQTDKDRYMVQKGDILCYDEAASQANARQAMTKGNINQTKLMICNRFLNLLHFWNCPKPSSVDIYIREQRAKMLIWVDAYYTKGWEQKIRNVYVYTKDSYSEMLTTKGWWYFFSNTNKLIRRFKPDLAIQVPSNLPSLIPKDIHEYYLTKKNVFNISQVLEMIEDNDDKPKEKETIDHIDRMAKLGESKDKWMQRTGLGPTLFTQYGGAKGKRGRPKG